MNSDQLDLLEEARRRRDDGMNTAVWSTDIAWARACDAAIARWAARGRPFTAEDIRREVGPPVGSPNALGARFMTAARRGLIRGHGWTQATRPEAAGRALKVWIGAEATAA